MDGVNTYTIGEHIRLLRKGMSQIELAALIRKSTRTVQKYENGEIEVSQFVAHQLGKEIQCQYKELYIKDMEKRLKRGTAANKKFLIDQKITPFFGKIPLNDIKLTDIRKWQNELTSYRDEKDNL